MGKGTPAAGRHSGPATHMMCRRCGSHSYFKRKGFCAKCGYGKSKRMRHYNWMVKIRAFNGHKARNGRQEMFKRHKTTKKH